MRRQWCISLAALMWVGIVSGPTAAAQAAAPPNTAPAALATQAGLPGVLDPVVQQLVEPHVPANVLPAEPSGALAREVAALGRRLGVRVDPGPRLAAAHLAPALAGRLALLLGTLGACMDATDRLDAGLPGPLGRLFDEAAAARVQLPGPAVAAVRACALRLEQGGLELEHFLAVAPRDEGGDLSLWPVLQVLNSGGHQIENDYVLSVDRGSGNSYFNNAGGNLIDVRRGPPGTGAVETAPARGCVNPAYDLADAQCIVAASLFVHMGGGDTYGRREAPLPESDGLCTDDPIVRRVITEGAGSFGGVGILINAGGHNTYIGKTVTQGAGHLGGVGILRNEKGGNTYDAIRMAKGHGVAGGVGIQRDMGGDNLYTYHMPRPLNPNAGLYLPGSGGVVSTTGICDNVPRWDEGVGFAGGTGILVVDGSGNVYRAAAPDTDFLAKTSPNASKRHTGSLGFGDDGLGVLIERAAPNSFSGMPGRHDGATIMPGPDSSGIFVAAQ